MKKLLFLLVFLYIEKALLAQQPFVYNIKADSVKITNSCDTAELIIENHTQNVPGFLFNKGRGRTEFRRSLQKLSDSIYVVGIDTLKFPNAWLQGGNTWGTTGIFGTKDNNPIDFYTNNTFRGRWTNTGNLLIGTTTDDNYKLRVSGTAMVNKLYISTYAGDEIPQISLQNEAGDYANYIAARGNDMSFGVRSFTNTYHFSLGPYSATANREVFISGNSDGTIHIGSPNNEITLTEVNTIYDLTNPINIISNSPNDADGIVVQRGARSTKMIDPIFTAKESTTEVFKVLRNGYVGIGTGFPSAQLHTTGTVRFSGLTNDSSQTRIVVCDAYGNLYYRSASSLAVNDFIPSDLAIAGTVSANKMLITQATPWPDYVFSRQYQLPSLGEVENFIKQNNHLPGIPSAGEVEKKGIDVAGNQAALLQKIEELTLYIIEQQKTINELQSLKQEIAELKALIKKQ